MEPMSMAILMGASALSGILQAEAARDMANKKASDDRIAQMKNQAHEQKMAQYQNTVTGMSQGRAQGTQNLLATRQAGADAQRALMDRIIQSYGQALL